MPNSVLYLAAVLIWGSTWIAITFQFGHVPATVSVAYRFLLAGSLLLLWCGWRGHPLRLPPKVMGWIAFQGALMFCANYVCVYEAERHIPSGLMAVLNSTMVALNLFGLRLAFGQPVESKSIWGAGLGVVGVALVFWPELAQLNRPDIRYGALIGLLAVLFASLGNLVAQRNRNHDVPLLPSIGYGMVVGGAMSLVLAVLSGQPLRFDPSLRYVGSLLYLALFGSIIAFSAYLTLLGRIGAARAGYTAILIPIVALLISTAFEGFVWQPATFLGMVLAVFGNWVMLGDVRGWWLRLRGIRGAGSAA
ncbi:DMT family transporter [Chitinimonas lacunae]|uniref:DMT family transporter n=1 Tax=Chitinimonas lacunae TaxID=1963018 RepID=A0ABV8MXK2_9NEIS